MKSRCPSCQTVFRVTPEQLKARAGKVRCGQCQTVFNALDSLLEEEKPNTHAPVLPVEVPPPAPLPRTAPTVPPDLHEPAGFAEAPSIADADVFQESSPDLGKPEVHENEPDDVFYISLSEEDAPDALVFDQALADAPYTLAAEAPLAADAETADAADAENPAPRLSESAAQALGKATGLIMPRETTEIPGYSKWSEGVIAAPLTAPIETPTRWPFVLVAVLLVLALAGQVLFHFRSELATALPSLRPILASASQALGSDLPLPRHVELISIEVSDLQNDAAHGNLLVLSATLRNRAAYGQAYPSLELSLTDTQDAAVARRVFPPAEYLPKTTTTQSFAANSDLSVRLWIDAKDVTAAGYRLYVFYP